MARDESDSEDLTEGTHAPRECMACRGTGRVLSNLGGSTSTLECPWCGGAGLRAPGLDAQAHWRPVEGESAPAPEAAVAQASEAGPPE